MEEARNFHTEVVSLQQALSDVEKNERYLLLE